jgi:6-phosphofructokinase 1
VSIAGNTKSSPDVLPLHEEDVGKWRPEDARVVAAALSHYHGGAETSDGAPISCLIQHGLCLPEAGPRQSILFPIDPANGLRVAILVSGGIAPGINAVIDGIVQRHYLYANPAKYADANRYRSTRSYDVEIRGLVNGFRAFEDARAPFSLKQLVPNSSESTQNYCLVTSEYANQGGSMIGTSRVDKLIAGEDRRDRLDSIVDKLFNSHTDILYVIGGDGSMKAAHAIWTIAKAWQGPNKGLLSVVAVPKTMDNDILWMWQSFGFMSAVERAREVIEHLATEIKSNPRLCVVQLFGSDSGFVVSHAVLASQTGHCDAALIPEVDFSMQSLARYMKQRMRERHERLPRGLVVMAETAVPTDALDFIDDKDIDLSSDEKEAIRDFDRLKSRGRRIQGQTNDYLRSAGLKIVSRGLHKLIPLAPVIAQDGFMPVWADMRVVVNEPRHILRAIPPSCTDIIMGHRLGSLAVDSAVAGYTDCMISQWLTEYVLVPLDLVVLGRKRIPDTGIFWKSVRAKTGQPAKLT